MSIASVSLAGGAVSNLTGRTIAIAQSLACDLVAFGFPQRCPGCGRRADPARLLCEDCIERIPRLATVLCVRCLSRGSGPAGCLRHPGYGVHLPWLYDERAALIVRALKYGRRPELAHRLGETMASALPPGCRPDLVLEVPLYPTRQRERGYNQAGVLADAVASHLRAPRLAGALERIRATRAQARLGPEDRRRNVAGAIRVREPDQLAERTIVIVDDVVTTGCTLEACLAPLRACGARATALAVAWAQ